MPSFLSVKLIKNYHRDGAKLHTTCDSSQKLHGKLADHKEDESHKAKKINLWKFFEKNSCACHKLTHRRTHLVLT